MRSEEHEGMERSSSLSATSTALSSQACRAPGDAVADQAEPEITKLSVGHHNVVVRHQREDRRAIPPTSYHLLRVGSSVRRSIRHCMV